MKIRKLYFRWLFDHVKNDSSSYLKLSEYLDCFPFRWTIPNDGNREQDAMMEREIFVHSESMDKSFSFGKIEEFYLEPVSIFEVMVALCKRMDYNLDELGQPSQFPRWYEELLSNLKLKTFTNDKFESRQPNLKRVDSIIDKLLSREYDRYGNGSFFPLRTSGRTNMRTTEIWYQMMAYFNENY